MSRRFKNPSPTTVIACLALFFAVAGGSAIALQGRNSVDSGDIKKGNVKTSDIRNNAVTTKKIKNNHVRAADIQNNAVGTGEIRDGQVAAADLAADEAYRKVGQPGQPAFANGGEGDCLYGNATTLVPGFGNPVAFYKDKNGIVHLAGHILAQDGSGGDGLCDNDLPSGEDNLIFTLPEGYRPANLELHDVSIWSNEGADPSNPSNTLIIGPASELVLPPSTVIPAGAVLIQTRDAPQTFSIDGITFRAAGAGTGLPRHDAGEVAGDIGESLFD